MPSMGSSGNTNKKNQWTWWVISRYYINWNTREYLLGWAKCSFGFSKPKINLGIYPKAGNSCPHQHLSHLYSESLQMISRLWMEENRVSPVQQVRGLNYSLWQQHWQLSHIFASESSQTLKVTESMTLICNFLEMAQRWKIEVWLLRTGGGAMCLPEGAKGTLLGTAQITLPHGCGGRYLDWSICQTQRIRHHDRWSLL